MERWTIYSLFFLIAGLAAAALAVNCYIVLSTRNNITAVLDEIRPAEAVLILGASVYADDKLSPILEERVKAALEIYQAGLVKKILVSGDNSTTEYNEVVPVRAYLLERGVPAEDIFLDYAGFDTYDSMYRASDLFFVQSAVIVTQRFHMYRALFIANARGIKVQGYVPNNNRVAAKNYLRESLARVKAVIDVWLNVPPVVLGEPIPISGDGRETFNEATSTAPIVPPTATTTDTSETPGPEASAEPKNEQP